MHRDQCKCSIALPQRFPVFLHLVSPEDAPCKAFMILWHFSSLFALVSKPMFRDYVVGFRKLAGGTTAPVASGHWPRCSPSSLQQQHSVTDRARLGSMWAASSVCGSWHWRCHVVCVFNFRSEIRTSRGVLRSWPTHWLPQWSNVRFSLQYCTVFVPHSVDDIAGSRKKKKTAGDQNAIALD
jgi:hypothetical protein